VAVCIGWRHGDKGLGAMDQGAELSAVICGVDPGATSTATFAHVGRESYTLGTEIHDAELGIHFSKSFKKV
jgi:hypothetical protein